jgi:RimJ/RimL family protein N-acetyltransferase
MVTTLATPRARLRPAADSDASELHEAWTSAGVRRFLWDGRIVPREQTDETIARSAGMFRDHGFGLWVARAADTLRFVGFAGLWPFRAAAEFELLYGVAEDLWGRGFASEIAGAIVQYCFGALDMPVVRASTDAANTASVRVLEKMGFHLTRHSTVGGLDTVFFECRRPE